MNAKAFNGNFFISVWLRGWLKPNQPHLLLLLCGHTLRALGFFFFRHLLLSQYRALQSERYIFVPDFFLSIYYTNTMLFLSFCIKITDFSRRLFPSFSSFGIPFLSLRMVPIIVTYFLIPTMLKILT